MCDETEKRQVGGPTTRQKYELVSKRHRAKGERTKHKRNRETVLHQDCLRAFRAVHYEQGQRMDDSNDGERALVGSERERDEIIDAGTGRSTLGQLSDTQLDF